MASLKDEVRFHSEEVKSAIGWIAVWKEGRSWHIDVLYPDYDESLHGFVEADSDDLSAMRQIAEKDSRAILVNGYYWNLGGADATLDEIVSWVRYHYEQGTALLSDALISLDELNKSEQAAGQKGSTMKLEMNDQLHRMSIENGTVEYKGRTYILLQQAYVDGNGSCDPEDASYHAPAICLGDEVDEDGYYPAYAVEWAILPDYDASELDESWACDWDSPISVDAGQIVWDPDRNVLW